MSESYLKAISTRTADAGSAAGGDISYADELRAYLTGALNKVYAAQPKDPFREIQQVCFQASLDGSGPLKAVTPIVASYELVLRNSSARPRGLDAHSTHVRLSVPAA